jgi:hypothetical protein
VTINIVFVGGFLYTNRRSVTAENYTGIKAEEKKFPKLLKALIDQRKS